MKKNTIFDKMIAMKKSDIGFGIFKELTGVISYQML